MATTHMIEACDRAASLIAHSQDMDRLYRKAIKFLGEGRLYSDVMSMAAEAIEDENLCEEVFSCDENMLSFFCGIWLQFLLTEIAGVKKEKLRSVASRVFQVPIEPSSLH